MLKSLRLTLSAAMLFFANAVFADITLIGREATADEVKAWDHDVRPDGLGLPEGSGSVESGEPVYIEHCAVCHGDFAEGVGRWPILVGGQGTLISDDPVKTIGSYWPYLSTVWDYINEAMPFGNARSLSSDDIYGITAYLLYMNDLVDEDFELSDENFREIRLPNEVNFYVDDRDQTEVPFFSETACMENCRKGEIVVIARASDIDVTPKMSADEGKNAETSEEASALAGDPELIAAGEAVFKKCKACHKVGEDAKNWTGPVLNGIVNGEVAAQDFQYSKPMKEMSASGAVWDEETLASFLADPRGYLKGTKMSFAGLQDDEDIAAVIAYLAQFQ